MSSNRLATPDIVKGIVIIGVLVTHLFLTPNLDPLNPPAYSVPVAIVYMTLMAFLVIAGYFYRSRGFLYNVKRRLLGLAVVFVFCTLALPIPMYGYFCLTGHEMDFLSGYAECLTSLIGYCNVFTPMDSEFVYPDAIFYTCIGYYFISLVIASSIVFYAIADRVLKDMKSTLVSLAILVSASAALIGFSPVHLPFEFELVPLSVAFMVVGAVLARIRLMEELDEKGLRNRDLWMILIGCLVFSFLFASIVQIQNGFHFAGLGEYGGWSAFPFFIEGCTVSVAAISLATVFARVPVFSKFLAFLGEHTLAILLLHTTLGKAIGFLFTSEYGSNMCPVLDAPVAIVVILAVALLASVFGIYSEKFYRTYIIRG